MESKETFERARSRLLRTHGEASSSTLEGMGADVADALEAAGFDLTGRIKKTGDRKRMLSATASSPDAPEGVARRLVEIYEREIRYQRESACEVAVSGHEVRLAFVTSGAGTVTGEIVVVCEPPEPRHA
jgi:hypothetical protein